MCYPCFFHFLVFGPSRSEINRLKQFIIDSGCRPGVTNLFAIGGHFVSYRWVSGTHYFLVILWNLLKKKNNVHQQKQTTNESNNCCSRLNASRATRNYFVDCMFVTPDVRHTNLIQFIVADKSCKYCAIWYFVLPICRHHYFFKQSVWSIVRSKTQQFAFVLNAYNQSF